MAKMQQQYQQEENSIVILYGREGIGKTSFLKKFVEDKPFVYYQAREWSEAEQNRYFDDKKEELLGKLAQTNEKICFIVDEFDLMQKGYKNFFSDFSRFVASFPETRVLLILSSSSVQWVENSMVDTMGELAAQIGTFIKLKEFTFMEMVDRFPESTTEECILMYSILGGVPAYLDLWNPK
ncbi:MAG: ATP-binding protein, partial [Eubacterium sp.]|nr:ATP-binding protein [Eubacterium sp.]